MSASDQLPLMLGRPVPSSIAIRNSQMLQTELRAPDAAEAGEALVSIRDLLRLLNKHKWTLLTTALLGLVVAVISGLTEVPIYSTHALLQIDRAAARIVSFNKDVDAGQESTDDRMSLQTQYELLRSRSLAERVVDDLGLEGASGPSSSSGAPQTKGLASAPTSLPAAGVDAPIKAEGLQRYTQALSNLADRVLSGYERVRTPSVSDQQVLSHAAVVNSLMGSVYIEPVRNSRLVKINVQNTDPEKAARIANAIAQSFITMSMERKFGSSVYAKNFLEDQIKQTKARLEESERMLNAYAKANSILTLDEKTSVISQTFTDYSGALSRAEQDRIKAEAVYAQVALNPESAPQVLENKTVQAYKEQRAKLEAEYLVNLGIYKPEFPKMLQTKAQIAELDNRIKGEVGNVLTSIKGQFEAAKRQEEQVRARLNDTRKEVIVTQDRGVNMSLLKRELDTNRQLYDSLLQRIKEVGVSAGVTTNNISIVDEAITPLFPFKPQLSRNAAFGLGLGLLLGIAIAIFREKLDDSIKHADEIEALFGLPLLGIIPMVRKKQLTAGKSLALLINEDPRGAFAEAYRSMRTALQFSTTEGAPKRLMVTSCVKSEGKSTTALALAINFAQLGKKVLLIDADMRSPTVHKSLEMRNDFGLSNFLSGDAGRETLIQASSVSNLSVLTAGPTPPNPVDLLMGPKLLMLLDKAEELGFHNVIIDAPPILGIADSIVLGNQVQSILFAVRASDTRRSSIKDALRRLRIAGLVPLGVALTRASSETSLYYGYDSYYGYGNDNGKDGSPKLNKPVGAESAASQTTAVA